MYANIAFYWLIFFRLIGRALHKMHICMRIRMLKCKSICYSSHTLTSIGFFSLIFVRVGGSYIHICKIHVYFCIYMYANIAFYWLIHFWLIDREWREKNLNTYSVQFESIEHHSFQKIVCDSTLLHIK